MKKNNEKRIAVIGCGRIAERHFTAISEMNNDLTLVAICDIDKKRMSTHSKKLNVPGYPSLKDLLNHETLDVIALCTPSGLHAEQTVLAASHGINVITEKPMATRWADGIKMVRACDDAGVKLHVVKQNRFNSTLKVLKRAIDEKRFGKINLVHINVFWTRPQSYYDQAKWRGTWEFDGGALMNQASHYVDLFDWLIGPVEKVHSIINTNLDIEVEDTAVVNLKWRNGAIGSISVSMLTYPENLEGSITILGENGAARIGGVAVNEVQLWKFKDKKSYDSAVLESNYFPTSVYGFGHNAYYKNVIDSLNGIANLATDGREGLKSLELLVAMYLSARDGKQVSLPLEI